LGHEAYSCDIIECSGGHPVWHIMQDVLPLLNGDCEFMSMDGETHTINGKWDMIIAFPPCTHLAVSGARHFEKKRADGRQREGIEFFCQFLNADCDRIAIENPVGIISGDYVQRYFPDLAEKYGLPKKPTQIIQPYQFGDPHRKTTCLWLKGLAPLTPTNTVEPDIRNYICKNGKKVSFDVIMAKCKDPGIRSKTFPGIAKAMTQWGGECE
jgi:site-specific DNA-cytosine methylase